MSWARRIFGLDGVDLLIHFGVTFAILLVGSSIWQGPENEIMLATVSGLSLVALGIRRKLALRHAPPLSSGEYTSERIAELEARMMELEQAQGRILELEERLDFAERLLARPRETERLS